MKTGDVPAVVKVPAVTTHPALVFVIFGVPVIAAPPEVTVKRAFRFETPKTFKVEVVPEVPILAVWPLETVIPAAAVNRPFDVAAWKLLAPAEIVRPFEPVIKPKTFRGEVVPEVPTFRVFPFEIVTDPPTFTFEEKDPVVAVIAVNDELMVAFRFFAK